MISFVEASTGETVQVKSAKIIAGKDAELTNLFLQQLSVASQESGELKSATFKDSAILKHDPDERPHTSTTINSSKYSDKKLT